MFEGHDRCSLCRCGISHHESSKRVDIDGVMHSFCGKCISKSDEVERHLRLRH